MKITLGAKELENIIGAWAINRYDAGVPSVKIVKKRDSIDAIIDYTNAGVAETFHNKDYCNPDEEKASFPAEETTSADEELAKDSEETQA